MRRCYQIVLEEIPQSEWNLRDYMEIVRMWNQGRGSPFQLVLDSDPKGIYIRRRDTNDVVLTLLHDLRVIYVDGDGLKDLIQIDWKASLSHFVDTQVSRAVVPDVPFLPDVEMTSWRTPLFAYDFAQLELK